MKVISLGLISSIIFTIVLAKNSPDSGSTTGCFGFGRKKPKKIHTTVVAEPVKAPEIVDFDPKLTNLNFIEEFEPITIEGCKSRLPELDEVFVSETDGMIIDKVTGFSRRENDSVLSGWYIRPYEEDYEDMIKVNFIPLREYYQRMENRPPKQYDGPPPVPDMPQISELPIKQEMLVKQTVSTVQEEDAATLNIGEEFDVEIDPKVSSYLGDRENDGEGGETQGEVEENQGEYEENQDEYEESQYEYEENQNKYEKIQNEYEETQGEYGETQGEVEENQDECEETQGEYEETQGEYGETQGGGEE
ncbi:erythrocyte membrane antigen 1 [Plasmodium chabaudi chabaudi]|uniref:Erythrocyte membrane antigen 1 n=1 Tax=Plasmodium chabaudi chabaudi TaxID=31271 RepID=A0A1D3LA30_PLACU|nr:erythrocyte membrane antigen 1 [Plasmodium chabaudi chabaudi]